MYSLEQINRIEKLLERTEVKALLENVDSYFAENEDLPNISDMLDTVVNMYKEKEGSLC